jgi:uncharacterized protein (TIGR02246 family)
MASIEIRLQALEDRAEISAVVSAYSLRILEGEVSRISELFTDDGVFVVESAKVHIVGREQLIAFFGKMAAGTTYPFVRTAAIVLDEDRAEHTGVMLTPAGDARGAYLGIYKDKLRKVDGRWLFAERSFKSLIG